MAVELKIVPHRDVAHAQQYARIHGVAASHSEPAQMPDDDVSTAGQLLTQSERTKIYVAIAVGAIKD